MSNEKDDYNMNHQRNGEIICMKMIPNNNHEKNINKYKYKEE